MGHDVAVIIGVGGIGRAIARRIGGGRRLLIADFDKRDLDSVVELLAGEGHEVVGQQVDVSDARSVAALAEVAGELGRVTHIAHTAGVSPTQAVTRAVLEVDLLGTALVLDAFEATVAEGGAGVVIASMSAYMAPLPDDQVAALAHTPAGELLALPFLDHDAPPGTAYAVAKRGNVARVQAAAVAWGRRGARLNSISPGVISTPMGREELDGESGAAMRAMVDASATGRLGTPDDIAHAAAFLLDPASSFIAGIDLLVDGGTVAGVRTLAFG
ncbi:SDR family oxidoreductase [Nocardia sp. NBC_01329]|uniref:SDR family oxidoreductase n=1 Tax=Nocardia sp. NBC_01329 TaxID=2903594 RepID=UPI002E143948|nr:SDR family oxidoreductase [Nocardia sp. NBC_01329]